MLLRRRNFLAGALGLPFICPGRAHAQTAAKPPEIGFVYEGIARAGAVRAKAFQEGLTSKGYEDGRTTDAWDNWDTCQLSPCPRSTIAKRNVLKALPLGV
jgi:hypothetical protein